ncbi:hypothetical protein EYR38_006220 [Pleurotus pulmonarius]|nr:hypothetical protein EYR38_006220 [Pleurotus pulmonarius]
MITVDYLVVGGGLAGLVVATRLAEDLDVVVGVLEAGQDMSRNQDIQTPGITFFRLYHRKSAHLPLPANYYKGIRNPETDWGFFTAPQDGLNGRRIYLPRGKGLGGSTLLNLMQLGRASAVEYNAFEQLGSKGWNWPEFLKYFKKSEAFHPDSEDSAEFGLHVADDVHGKSGPLPKIMPPRVWPLHSRVIEAFTSVGIPFNAEPNDGANAGCWTGTAAIHPGQHTRASSASAYYEPNRDKSNLIIVTGAYATRVLFDPKEAGDLLATAVEYQKDGEIHVAHATKEVILCTGSFKTPQLLELSGIGDKKILDPLNIPVIIDLPGVGSNLRMLATISSYLPNTKALPLEGKNYISFVLGLLHPFSRGHVHIRSPDPSDNPIIDPCFLNNATDIEFFLDAVKLVRKVVNARCIKSAIARETAPGPSVQFDAEIVDYLKGNVQTIYHPIGTTPMFPREDGGVVDESLKVYGTNNLRVVDASVIPLQISAHIQHTVYAIAEKAADIIKAAR